MKILLNLVEVLLIFINPSHYIMNSEKILSIPKIYIEVKGAIWYFKSVINIYNSAHKD